MAKMLETLKQTAAARPPVAEASTPPASPPVEAAVAEEVPFIEVGGRQKPMEASPAVLAAKVSRPGSLPAPHFPQIRAAGPEIRTVSFIVSAAATSDRGPDPVGR